MYFSGIYLSNLVSVSITYMHAIQIYISAVFMAIVQLLGPTITKEYIHLAYENINQKILMG